MATKANLEKSKLSPEEEKRIREEAQKSFDEDLKKKKEREAYKATNASLTKEEEERAIQLWKEGGDSVNMRNICEAMFGFKDLRLGKGRALKEFFAKKRIKIETGHSRYVKKGYTLSEEHKKFIINNKDLYDSRIELCRNCFDDPNLNALSLEARAAYEFLEEIGAYNFGKDDPKYLADKRHLNHEYKPPNTIFQAVKLVNNCLKNKVNSEAMTVREKRDMEALISYMNKNRFLRQINGYEAPEDRTTFENSFISYVYDKGDLTQEELDQYIILSNEVVSGFQIQKLKDKTLKAAEELLDADDNETKAIGKGLVDHSAQLNTEYNQCIKRQDTLFRNLTKKRSERLELLKGKEYNLFNLVESFREQENREKMVKMAEKYKEETKDKLKEFDDMDELDAMLLGISPEEVLYG
jgi:hypothetical protein